MKTKTINKVISTKFQNFLDSIEDSKVKALVRDNTIITGGCIASMYLQEPVNDFDIYFRNKKTLLAVANYYVDKFKELPRKNAGIECNITVIENKDSVSIMVKSAGIATAEGTEKPYQYFEMRPPEEAGEYVSSLIGDPDEAEELAELGKETGQKEIGRYIPVFLSSNAITLSDKIQIITRFCGEPDVIHENFDFVHCTNYWDSATGKLILRTEALECLLSRELRYVGSRFPVCSVFRLRKFIKRNWTVNAGQILKMAMQISDLNLHDPAVLRDQLVGVDSAFFHQVLNILDKKGDSQEIDFAYLIEVIDRVF